MKAIVINAPGAPDTFTMADMPVPQPGPGEIRVQNKAISLNPADYKMAANGNPAWQYPFIPGLDAAGIVDAVGEGVTRWAVGDRVAYHGSFMKPGTYAEYSVTNARTAGRIPQGVSYEEAAAFPCAGLTAYQALIDKMNVKAGRSILIHAGAGGVGGYAIQLAKLLGASPILTTASEANNEYLQQLGADVVIDYHTEDVAARVKEATNGLGVDYILNSLNRATAQADLTMLAFGGQLACIAGAPETVADFQPSHKTFSVHKMMLGGAHLSGDARAESELAMMTEEFMQLIDDRMIDAMVEKTISLAEIPAELTRLSQRHVRGKIVAVL
ncbi:NADPH:quinone reductase [Paenibacillus catalpae]|uniref:NADPH:quinone reductase n=1 Tax=Paenibacillus catalpae TaxID=1045775 RepID=A0A1I1VKH7_9BACL|nr:zinc-binding dehydrogenase [Paenibacillus catalpae]SFD82548.1 NADPH:quinone reductase [Paenibacillus catalpae]